MKRSDKDGLQMELFDNGSHETRKIISAVPNSAPKASYNKIINFTDAITEDKRRRQIRAFRDLNERLQHLQEM